MTKFANRAKMSISSTGTGNVTLNAAVAGYRTFAAAGIVDTDQIRYIIEDANGAWEIGTGLMSSSATVMARTVEESSNSNAALNLTSAAKVLIGLTAGDLGSKVYATINDLVAVTGMVVGDMAMVSATKKMYMYTASGWWFIATLTNTAPTSISGANASYALAADGTATTVTLTSTDPEGFPITFSHTVTTGSLGSTATVTQNNNVFTITPSTNSSHEGSFSLTFSASDGASVSQAVSAFTLSFGYDLANGSYDSKSFSCAYQESNPQGVQISADGTKMYVLGVSKTVHQYNLSTAYDASTASYSTGFNPPEDANNIGKVVFNPTGTKMFILSLAGKLWEYTLSIGFNLSSTITYTNNSYTFGATIFGVDFNATGTRMFALSDSTDEIKQFNLSTGFDLSTISTTSNSFSVASQTTNPQGMAVNSAGTKVFIADGALTYNIYEYSASTGFDASTISYAATYHITNDLAGPTFGYLRDLAFSASGHKMYLVSNTYDKIEQFSAQS